MEIKKSFRAAEIGTEYFCGGYGIEIVLNLLFFIITWFSEGEREILYSSYIMYWLISCNLWNFMFNIVHGIKRYDRQERIADIVDFLPMNRETKNFSNFLINYRKSINLLIPYILMYLYNCHNDYSRGILTLNIIVVIITESIRNIFMKKGCMRSKRREIFICDFIPVATILITEILMFNMVNIYLVNVLGNFCIGVILGILSLAFMLYTAVKYKELV